MTSVADLYLLQEIDLELEAKQAALAELEERLGESDELRSARLEAAEKPERLRETQRGQRDAEWAVEEVRAKIQPLEEKLYGGSVKNPKELVGFQQDVDSLKGRQRELEDRVLEAMALVEEAERELAASEVRLSEVETQWRAEQEDLVRQGEELRREIEGLEGRRSAQGAAIDAGTMSQYDALRKAHQGRAVAKVERGICQGCRISLPMHVVQQARRGNPWVQCTSCERILYVS